MLLLALALLGRQPVAHHDTWDLAGGPYYPAFWVYGSGGMHIYSTDGVLQNSNSQDNNVGVSLEGLGTLGGGIQRKTQGTTTTVVLGRRNSTKKMP